VVSRRAENAAKMGSVNGTDENQVTPYRYDRSMALHWCVDLRLGLNMPVSRVVLWWGLCVYLGLRVRISWILGCLRVGMLDRRHWLAGGAVRVCVGLALRRARIDRSEFRRRLMGGGSVGEVGRNSLRSDGLLPDWSSGWRQRVGVGMCRGCGERVSRG
jgi:hypothetical protein